MGSRFFQREESDQWSGNQAEIRSACWMGRRGQVKRFSADVSEDEAYKFRAVMFSLVLGTCSNTTQHLNTTGPIMEDAICTLVTQFKTYAGKDGSSSTLSKDEFQNLVISQLPNYVKNASDPKVVEELMGSLDENNDGELTFSEFWQLIGTLASKQGGFPQ
ncbi:protein S100-A11 [Cheilinus undulatus]|uniref:protein S100-A11 n=1 Tax=Cheilinus undulatus TaxID=241271 RepID=UPI001BD46BFB|nr:protein S100-A11 [Cheilinus undulatus]